MKRKALISTLSVLSFLGTWQVGSILDPAKFPPPAEVFDQALSELTALGPRGNTGLYHLQVTFTRVFLITILVLVISFVVGILMGTREEIEEPLANILPVWLAVPSVIAVLVGMVMFNFSTTAVIVSVSFVTIPFGIINTYEGTKSVDQSLLEMAHIFEFSDRSVWRYIYIPAILPYLFASSRYLLGMIWKIVLLAETFGVSSGVGSMIRFWYVQGEITIMLAYFSLFAVVVLAIEYLILAPAERRAFTWRQD